MFFCSWLFSFVGHTCAVLFYNRLGYWGMLQGLFLLVILFAGTKQRATGHVMLQMALSILLLLLRYFILEYIYR